MLSVLYSEAGENRVPLLLITLPTRMTPRAFVRRNAVWGLFFALMLSVSTVNSALAKSDRHYDLEIRDRRLGDAAQNLSRQTGLELLFPFELADTVGINLVVGRYTVPEALDVMLSDTGYSGSLTTDGVITIFRRATNDAGQPEVNMSEYQKPSQSLLGRMLTSVAAVLTATAATPDSPVRAQEVALEEIVVTTRKREESLQDVPLSITALTLEDITRRNITDLESVARQTAGLIYEDLSTTFNGVLTIRGLAQAEVQNRVQNVAVFVDGVYIPRNYSVDMGISDFERIEVVKGPQSALYGQNAFAGALNYVTLKPSLTDFEGSAELTLGTAGRLDYKFAAGGPIVEDVLAVRGFYGSTEFNGNRRNNFPNIPKSLEKTGGYDREAINLSAIFTPAENLEIDLLYKHVERSEEVRPGYTVSGNRPQILLNCGPATPNTNGNPAFYCGEIPNSANPFQSPLSRRLPGDLFAPQPGSDTESDLYRASLGYQFDDAWRFDYTYGRVEAKGQEIAHITDDPAGFGVSTSQKEGGINDFESHEARVSYTPADSPFSAELGFYNADQQDDFVFHLGLVFGFLGPVVIEDTTSGFLDTTGFFIPLRNFVVNETTDALFGSLSYDFADDRATLTVEARNSWVDVNFFDNVARIAEQTDNYNNFTPRITLEYDATEDSMLYASVAKGVKAGGFNGFVAGPVNLLAAEQTFSEEKNWTYEIGSKNTFADGRFAFNAAAYYVDWSSAQVQSLPSNFDTVNLQAGSVAPTIFLNIGDVKSWGIELDGTYVINENFSINFSATTSDPKYKSGTKVGQFVGICDGIFCPADGDVSGNSLPRQSKTQATFGAQYETPILSDYEFYARADLTYQSKRITDAMNFAWAPERYNLSASAGIIGDNWSLTAWGDNLTAEKYATSSLFIIQFSRYGPAVNDGPAGGLTLKVNI